MNKNKRLTTNGVDKVGADYSEGSIYEARPRNDTVSRTSDSRYSHRMENVHVRTNASKRHEAIAQINQELKKLSKR